MRPHQAAVLAYQLSKRAGLRELRSAEEKLIKAQKKKPPDEGEVASLEAERGRREQEMQAQWDVEAAQLGELARRLDAEALVPNVVEPIVEFMHKLTDFYAVRGSKMPTFQRRKAAGGASPLSVPSRAPEPPEPSPTPLVVGDGDDAADAGGGDAGYGGDGDNCDGGGGGITPPPVVPAAPPIPPTPAPPSSQTPTAPSPAVPPVAPAPPAKSDRQLALEAAAREKWRLQEEAADAADEACAAADAAYAAAAANPRDKKLQRAADRAAKRANVAVARATSASDEADAAKAAAEGPPPPRSTEVVPSLAKLIRRGYKEAVLMQWVELLRDPSNQRNCTAWTWDKWQEVADEAIDDYDISMIRPHEVPTVLYVVDEDDAELLYGRCISWGYTRESCDHIVRTLLRAAQMNTHLKVQTETGGPWKVIADEIRAIEGSNEYSGSEVCKAAFRHQTRQQRPPGGWRIG